MLTIAEVLTHFAPAKRVGPGKWRTVCPVHGGGSLVITDGESHILFKCWAQDCPLDALLAASGLTRADISPSNGHGPTTESYAAVHDYRDATGVLRYQTVRMRTPPGAKKKFLQRRPGGNGAGAWIWDLKGITRLPYRLHELAGHSRVFIPEGEKDVDRLWSLGLPATCNSGGAGHWLAGESAALKAIGVQRAVLLPDADAAGAAHVATAETHLTAAGIRCMTLPPFQGVPATGGDVSDWLDAGHTVAELEALLLERSPVTVTVLSKLAGLDAMLQEPEDLTRWIVEDRIPAGSVCLLVAKPKVGKTTAARHLAVAIARGESWLGSQCEQGLVWYMAFEGRKADHLSHFRQFHLTPEEAKRIWCYVDSPTPTILAEMRTRAATDKPTLIIVDTLQRLLQVKSMDDYAEVTKAFDALIALVREVNCALLLLHHAGKAMDRDPLDSVLGSTAIAGSVDNTMVLSKLAGFRTVTTRQRVGPDLDERVIQLTETGRVILGGSREDAERHTMMEKMVRALEHANSRLTTTEWLDLVEGRKQNKLAAIRQLVDDGRVVCQGKGRRDSPFIYAVPQKQGMSPLSQNTPETGTGRSFHRLTK